MIAKADKPTSTALLTLFSGLLALAAGLAGCGDDPVGSGCSSDDECRGSRVCLRGQCAPNPGGDTGMVPDTDVGDSGEIWESTPDTQEPPDTRPDTDSPDPPDTGDTGTAPPPDVEDTGPDVPAGPKAIKVTPANQIDYGTIVVGASVTQKLVVENVGGSDGGPLTVKSVGLRQTPSTGFAVSGPSTPLTLSPGEKATFDVTFNPPRTARYGNQVDIKSDDPDASDQSIEVEVRGTAVNKLDQPCLFTTPDNHDFGVVQPGQTGTSTLTLGNCSQNDTVTVTQFQWDQNPKGVFGTTGSPKPPFRLQVNETKTVTLTYTPDDRSEESGRMTIRSDETTGGTDRVELSGSGGGCAEAEALAEVTNESQDTWRDGPIPVAPMQAVALSARESSSPSGMLDYSWRLSTKPSGSSANLNTPMAETTKLLPDTPGRYVVGLTVTDPATGQPGCSVDTVEIIALKSTPALSFEASWQADHDLDVHLVRSDTNGMFPSFADPNNDVYPDKLQQDWGQSGDPTDDAFHLGGVNPDNTGKNSGTEKAILASMEPNRSYRLAVHFSDPNGFRPPRFDLKANLTVGGNTQSLSHRFTLRDRNQYWIVWEVDGKTGKVTKVDTEQ